MYRYSFITNTPQHLWRLPYVMSFSVTSLCALCPQGCHPDQVRAILSRLPVVSQKFAKYWICRARLMEQEGNLDVLPMFEEAVSVVLEVRCLY